MKQGIYGASVLRTIVFIILEAARPRDAHQPIIDSIYHISFPDWINFHELPGDLARLFGGDADFRSCHPGFDILRDLS